MGKYRDQTKCRLETEVKYDPNELPAERHDRRHFIAKRQSQRLGNYCRSNGFKFRVLNEGQHFQIERGVMVLDWWPRTAKMVVNKKWKQAIHVHDTKQIISYLAFLKLLG
jgi:hypothetical protein